MIMKNGNISEKWRCRRKFLKLGVNMENLLAAAEANSKTSKGANVVVKSGSHKR